MNQDLVLDLAREAVYTVIISAGPLLLVALGVGLLVSIFQTVTSIQEQTLAFVPKILAVFASIVLFGSFIGNNVLQFFIKTVSSFGEFIIK